MDKNTSVSAEQRIITLEPHAPTSNTSNKASRTLSIVRPCAVQASDPWQCTLSHACYAKAPETKDPRRDARGRQRVHPTPWQCALSHACNAKAPETKDPRRDARGRQGVHPTPWQCTFSHACHAKAPETKDPRRDARGRPGVHPTLGSAHCPTPATQKHRRPRIPGGTPGDARAYMAVHIVPRLPRKITGDQGSPGDARGRQGIHPTP